MDAKNLKFLLKVKRRKHDKCMRKKLRALQKEYQRRQVKFATKIGIVYEKTSKELVVFPYFDSSKKFQIWGVCIEDNNHKIMISKEDFGKEAHVIANENWFYVLLLHAFVQGKKLPDAKEAEIIYRHKKQIDEIIDIFISYGIKADKLKGPYVIYDNKTSLEDNPENKMIIFNLDAENNNLFADVGCFEHYLTRLVK